jgi:hypothetical protein
VGDVGREDRHGSPVCTAVVTGQVVTDFASVDDDYRPGVVRVPRVPVLHEPGVEDLGDTRNDGLALSTPLAAYESRGPCCRR